MFENYIDETELLTLMLDKEEFLQYIKQKLKNNDCCTRLEPLIWAIHFNISKHQRLPLLEKIFIQNMQYIKACYSFLPRKQIFGKTYEAIGIPTSFGKPNKYFLDEYKKYKSYYPVRFPKKCILYNKYDSIKKTPRSIYNLCSSSKTKIDQEIICSTPISKQKSSIVINPILSPIRILSNNLFANQEEDGYLNNMSNYIKENNCLNVSDKKLSLSKIFEICGSTGTKSLINANSQYIQTENNVSQSNINNTCNSWIEESPRKGIKDKNVTLVNFDDIEKKNHIESTELEKSSILSRELTNIVLKQSLNKKKNNNNLWLKKKRKSSLFNNITSYFKQIKRKVKKPNLESSISELCTKQSFSDILISDLDNTDQDSIMLEYNNTQELQKMMTNLSKDKENNRNGSNSLISVNSIPFLTSLTDHSENTLHNNISDINSLEFMKWSYDNYDANNKNDKVTTVFNKQFNENMYSKSKQNIHTSIPVEFDISSISSINNQSVLDLMNNTD